MAELNHTLLCDFYELTMANGYFELGKGDEIAYFDVFFRKVPDGGGFAIAAGLEQVIDYIKALRFTDEDIEFLRTKGIFSEDFLSYLKTFRFTGDIYAVRFRRSASRQTALFCPTYPRKSGRRPTNMLSV